MARPFVKEMTWRMPVQILINGRCRIAFRMPAIRVQARVGTERERPGTVSLDVRLSGQNGLPWRMALALVKVGAVVLFHAAAAFRWNVEVTVG